MSRFDNIGLFWQDVPHDRAKGGRVRPMPPIPDTRWSRPTEFPDLSKASVISIDVETWDPELVDKGPGWARGKGHIVGIAIGADHDFRAYYPIRHEVCAEQNLPPEDVLAWAKEQLSRVDQAKVGANITYDVGWLCHEGVPVNGPLFDVQFAEALLSETSHVALEVLGQKYLNQGKDSSVLYDWLSLFYGGPANGKQRANIYRCPPSLVGPYAEGDVDLPLRILQRQWPLLERDRLLDLFYLECELIPLMVEMRFAGVPVDLESAQRARERLIEKEKAKQAELRHIVGFDVNVNAADSLAKAFKHLGIPFGRTKPTARNPNGRPSFTGNFLDELTHPVGEVIREIKKFSKTRGTFLEGYILNASVDGYVYPQFHQLRGDAQGTRSGRFSSSDPNYQNLPSRDEEIGPLVRSCVIPDARLSHTGWRRYDYSQIEYRFLVHFAVGQGIGAVVEAYRKNPDTDYHELVRQLIHTVTGILLERKPTKNINFGLVYGMGIKHLAEVLHMSTKQAKVLFRAYHQGAPFVKETMDRVSAEANQTGIITTVLGRRSQFNLWTAEKFDEESVALPYEAAVATYGRVRRAFTHKALNRRLQGSAADLMKTAMLRCWKDGVFNVTGVPRLTVHDELDFSDACDPGMEEAFAECHHILETAMTLRIPVKADMSTGPHWGACK